MIAAYENSLPARPSNSRSQEDQDLLERSTKKTKMASVMRNNGMIKEGIDQGQMMKASSPGTGKDNVAMSYRCVLERGKELECQEVKQSEAISDDEDEEANEGCDSTCPVIKMTKEEKACLRRP